MLLSLNGFYSIVVIQFVDSVYFIFIWDTNVWMSCFMLPLFIGFPQVINKLKDLVPVLLNSFQGFITQARASPKLDGTSSSCMVLILNCIDMIIRSFIHGSSEELAESQSSLGDHGVMLWEKSISSLMLMKLYSLFPLYPVHGHSEKVLILWVCFLNLFLGRGGLLI